MRIFIQSKIILCAVILFLGCEGSPTIIEEDCHIVFDLRTISPVNNLYGKLSDMQMIPIETSDSCVVNSISKIGYAGGYYFVLDKKQRVIFCLDEQGRLRYKIDHVGRGPKEYISITDFSVHDNGVYVLDLDKILIYDMAGNHKRSIRLNEDDEFCSISLLKDGEIVLTSIDSRFSAGPIVRIIDAEGGDGLEAGTEIVCLYEDGLS